MSIDVRPGTEIVYPESDGKPMADNTLQWDWMVKIVGELRDQYAGQEVFVAGDLFWYPVEGQVKIVSAPDALVVFGRPPGYRGSYKQWEEAGIAPQVVFEVLSPNNTPDEMADKRDHYELYGVKEYYMIDPYQPDVEGYRRRAGKLVPVRRMNGYVSPLLGVRFVLADGELLMVGPDGRTFQTREERVGELMDEMRRAATEAEQERKRAATETRRARKEARRADAATARADAEQRRADALAAKLRELGFDPDNLSRPPP